MTHEEFDSYSLVAVLALFFSGFIGAFLFGAIAVRKQRLFTAVVRFSVILGVTGIAVYGIALLCSSVGYRMLDDPAFPAIHAVFAAQSLATVSIAVAALLAFVAYTVKRNAAGPSRWRA